MAKHLSTNTLIESVVRRAMLPTNQVTFKEKDFLAFANEELDIGLIPHILSYHEDYLLQDFYTAVTPSVSRYELPYRATGNKIRDVAYLDDNGNLFEMTRITVEDLPYYQNGSYGVSNTGVRGFYMENDTIVLVPENRHNTTGRMRITYYLRANQLVSESDISVIRSIDRNTGIITVDKIPSKLSSPVEMDFLQLKSPHKRLEINVTPTSVDALNKTYTFNVADIPEHLVVGDHLAFAEECIIPNIPTDLHSMLAQRIACRCLEAMNDAQGLALANQKLAEMELKTGQLIDNRVEGAPMKVVNRHGFLRLSRRMLRR